MIGGFTIFEAMVWVQAALWSGFRTTLQVIYCAGASSWLVARTKQSEYG
jgi:hypothetical protein